MDHLVELGAAMTRFAEVADVAFGDEKVQECPGWSVDDLVAHLGTVHRWAASIVLSGQRVEQPAQVMVGEPRAEWYAGTAAALLSALQAVHPDEPVPNFSLIDERARFWSRRQLHEVTIHTVDLERAVGLTGGGWPIDPAVAADGIDEVLRIMFARMTARGQRPDLVGRVRLRATDLGRTWLVEPGPGPHAPPILVHDPPGTPADAQVSGTAEQLYLALWKRGPVSLLGLDGDAGRRLLTGTTVP